MPHSRPRPLKGILLVVLATLTFALADIMTKQLTANHPVAVVVAIRYLFNLGLLTLFLGPRFGKALWQVNRRGLVFLRAFSLALASMTMGFALQLMPVGETVAIIYLAPILVMILAIPVLGEKVSLFGWLGAAGGFIGVLLIVRPGAGLDPLGVTFALANACLGTGYHLLTRYLSRSENTIALLYQTALVGSVFFCVMSLGSLDHLDMTWTDFGWMALLGALATLGHYLFTAAYREAPASMLAPVNYLHLAWAGGLGWVIFGHLPDMLSISGMALVCASGAVVAIAAAMRKPAVIS